MGSLSSSSGMPGLSRPELMPEAVLDQELATERDVAATPLVPGARDALVDGIAAVFASLEHSDRAAAPAREDVEAALDEDITFALLGELNRLWQSPAA